MFGEPKDVDGECNACLFIADNYGDNSSTIRCQLPPNHAGLHQERFNREGGPVTITWFADERKKCDHGCGQWEHDHQDFVVLATATIDGSHGGAREQNGLRSSAKTGPGHYELKIAGILPPDALVTISAVSAPVSITSAVMDGVLHVQTIGVAVGVDADFRVEVAKPSSCPKYAGNHAFSDCAFCHPGEEGKTCEKCGGTYYYEEGHKRHCPKEPFTCADCGASGLGVHACPKDPFFDNANDEFAEDAQEGT